VCVAICIYIYHLLGVQDLGDVYGNHGEFAMVQKGTQQLWDAGDWVSAPPSVCVCIAISKNQKDAKSNGNFRILKWRYCIIFLAIFCGSWDGHWPFFLSMFSKGTTAVTVPALTLKIHWRVRSLKGLRAKARWHLDSSTHRWYQWCYPGAAKLCHVLNSLVGICEVGFKIHIHYSFVYSFFNSDCDCTRTGLMISLPWVSTTIDILAQKGTCIMGAG
jgi:hypothetical protein